MARLQILELPAGSNDDRPPFVLVVDQVPTYEAGFDALRRDLGTPDDLLERIGARAVLVFEDTIDIPANDTSGYLDSGHAGPATVQVHIEGDVEEAVRRGVEYATRKYGPGSADARNKDAELRAANEWIERLASERDGARQWARHGYEIGQRHCGWTDHGVAPGWLTEGWPPHIDSCEYLKQAAEYDAAVSRVRSMDTRPEVMDAQQEHPDVWLHGYECGVLAAKAAIRPRNEPTTKRTDD